MKIVLFDDDLSDLKKLNNFIMDWSHQYEIKDIIIHQFRSISDLEFSFGVVLYSDVFFLDIMTPESQSTGFVLAEKIHLNNPRAIIIFTTNSREYMQNAFEISAFRYLLKPLDKEQLFRLLNKIYEGPSLRSQTFVVLPGIFQNEVIDADRIVYIKARTTDHRADVFLTDGSIVKLSLVTTPFSKLTQDNLSPDFIQCHRSFIINLNYITGFDSRTVQLRNQYQIEIGKTYRSDLINRIINHHRGTVLQ